MAITGSDKPHALVGQGTVFDGIAYWVSLAGIYLMVGGLMFYSGKGKLFDDDGNAPEGIKEQFKGTFLDTFPGVDTAWFTLGVLEFAVFILLLVSVIRLEFFPHKDKSVLQVGLSLALLVFACLAFGQTATSPVLRNRLAVHVLRVHGDHPDLRESSAPQSPGSLARRARRGDTVSDAVAS